MGPAFSRKYNTAITAGTAQSVKIPMIKRGVTDYAVGADWTPVAGDVKVSKDGGAAANIATLPAAVAMGNTAYWEFVFSNTELSCGTLTVTVADSATKAVEDTEFLIESFGNASALYQADWSLANLPANVTQILGTAASAPATAGILEVNVKNWNNLAAVALPLIPTTAGRTLDVTATGGAGIDWANVEAPTTALDLSNTTIKTTQVVGSVTGAVGSVTGAVGSVSGAVGSVTGNVGGNVTGSVGSVVGAVGSVTGLTASNLDATISSRATPAQILTTALTEAYAADGVAPTLAQLLFGVQAFLQERSVSGVTVTSKKLDGSTTAMTFTLNDANTPTSITRAT